MISIYGKNKNNEWVDLALDEDSSVSFTIQLTDYSSPSSVKNWFTKTITLLGNSSNNAFFSNVFNVNTVIGSGFEPNKKCDCYIEVNGHVFDIGYFVLDSITKSDGKLTYSVTYYSMVGRFLYNLSTNEETNESLHLYDLYFKLPSGDRTRFLSKTEEGPQTEILQLNSKTLYDYTDKWLDYYLNWATYKNLVNSDPQKRTDCNICWIPCYSGLSENKDNEKIILYQPDESTLQKFAVPSSYIGLNYNYYKGEFPRDLDEWEVGDFRAKDQRLGIRYSFILDACFDPENNGGFKVKFPYKDDFNSLVGAVYNNAFIVNDRTEFDDNEDYEIDSVEIPTQTELLSWSGADFKVTFPNDYKSKVGSWLNSNLRLSSLLNINIKRTEAASDKIAALNSIYFWTETASKATFKYWVTFNFIGLKVSYVDETGEKINKRYLLGSVSDKFKSEFTSVPTFFRDHCSAAIANLKNTKNATEYYEYFTEGDFINMSLVYKSGDYSGLNWVNDDAISLIFESISKNIDSVSISIKPMMGWFISKDGFSFPTVDSSQYSAWTFFNGTLGDSSGTHVPVIYNCESSKFTIVNDEDANYYSQLYSGTTSDLGVDIVKKINLFDADKTPADYLLAFIKMCNLRLMFDPINNEINLLTLKDFYSKYGNSTLVDVSDSDSPIKIDWSSDIESNYNFYDSRIYNYNFTDSDCYPEYLYYKSEKSYMNKYVFNTYNETLDADSSEDYLDNALFSSCVDYNQRSNYYSYVSENEVKSPVLKGASFTLSYFTTEGEYDTEDLSKIWNKQTKVLDPIPKLALFDKDNGAIEGKFLCFFEGTIDLIDQVYQISDKTKLMKDMNDDNDCFIYWNDKTEFRNLEGKVPGPTSLNPYVNGTLGYNVRVLPKFGMLNYYDSSTQKYAEFELKTGSLSRVTGAKPTNGLYWQLPKKLYSNSEIPKQSIYTECFERFNDDVYSKSTNTLTLSCVLSNTLTPDWLIRHKYLIDGSIYVINKITDYNPETKNVYQLEFRRTFEV